ncbi:MAG: gliding motility-associated protein GldE [Bacteroidetes bacterium]|nr:MAG: gliding motility-associated protein GldE [Bacteroidota bacterium]
MSSALISGSEIAFFSLSPNDTEALKQEPKGNSQRIISLMEEPRKLLATILITNNFINIGIVIISAFVLNMILPSSTFLNWSERLIAFFRAGSLIESLRLADIISFLITVLGVTFVLVLFGEITPKVYARHNNIGLSKTMATPLWLLSKIFHPFSMLLVNWTSSIERRLEKRRPSGSLANRQDIGEAIDLTADANQTSNQEVQLLKRIVNFGEVSVSQIIQPRVDVVAIDESIDYSELLATVKKSGYSRIPVFEKDFDNVKGILYVKDLLGHLNDGPEFDWKSLIRKNILFVPETKKIDSLLREFQKERMHMAIVVDEYGGSSGIVTMEDILEEIIGEIQDEFDTDSDIEFKKVKDGVFVFEGKTLINDFCRLVKVDTIIFEEARGEADTLAGILLEKSGRLPEPAEEFEIEDFQFKVLKVNKRRIEQIRIELPKNMLEH